MGGDEHEDPEKGGVDMSPTTSDETSSIPEPTQPKVAAAEGPEVSQERFEDDTHEDTSRGRLGSSHARGPRTSDDSQRTCSDDETHDVQVATPHRDRSRARSSVRSVRKDAVVVPRKQRRGLFARLAVIPEVTEPWDYARRTKWTITFIVAVAAAAAPMGSSIILPALADIQRTFNSPATVVNLSVAMYMLSMSIFPLWWSSFSETLGRRTIYIASFALFLIFNILAAVSTNIAMFIVTRLLAGGAAASVQAVGAGSVADIWEVKERGRAMGLFYLGPLCGPLLSPIIGGALAEGLGWRSAQWFLAIYGAFVLVFIIVCLPETLRQRKSLVAQAAAEAEARTDAETKAASQTDEEKANGGPVRQTLSRTTTAKSVHVRTKKYLVMLRRAFLDPLRIIIYLKFPAVALCVAYASITFGTLYVLNISVQQTFSQPPYGYSSLVVGSLYLPNSLGYFLSSIFGGPWVDRIMHREARKAGRYDERGRLQFRPEDRMRENAWLGALLYPCALIVYGWTTRYGINTAAPMVANFFFGIGSMLVFALLTTMLTEFMPRKASHGIALNNFVRNVFSCVGTIVAEPLIVTIGDGWLFTGLGVISLVSGSLTIWAMKRFGDSWRVGMEERMEKAMGD